MKAIAKTITKAAAPDKAKPLTFSKYCLYRFRRVGYDNMVKEYEAANPTALAHAAHVVHDYYDDIGIQKPLAIMSFASAIPVDGVVGLVQFWNEILAKSQYLPPKGTDVAAEYVEQLREAGL
jgi:hypothetical protein